jgi:acetoin utilization deacetylase AcuC-like enzyme
MTLLYQHDRFVDHLTGPGHPECPARYEAIQRHPGFLQLARQCDQRTVQPVDLGLLPSVHKNSVLEYLITSCRQGGGRIEADTVVSPDSYDVARFAAGAGAQAVEAVLKGDDTTALCVVRPPGHHATPTQSMGFCLFNNIALAAWRARLLGVRSVLIVDFDVHHGNGTQDAFYDSERTTFLSLHRHPFYPGTGMTDESGTGAGLGHTINVPLPFGISPSDYHAAFDAALEKAVTVAKPDLILVSAGFDAHAEDPIGSLGLGVEDYVVLTQKLKQAASVHSKGRIVSCLEGGYNLTRMPECLTVHLEGLMA